MKIGLANITKDELICSLAVVFGRRLAVGGIYQENIGSEFWQVVGYHVQTVTLLHCRPNALLLYILISIVCLETVTLYKSNPIYSKITFVGEFRL